MSDKSKAEEIWKDFLLELLKISEIGQGADICDRCGGTIWPELELVRCDFCVGEHGAPSRERIQAAYERHKERIHHVEREERSAFQDA
jgi:hypothetical protein